MKRILLPTTGAGDWARLLAQPELHWKVGRSAMSLAASWETARPLMPREIATALDSAGADELRALSVLVAMPEFTTPLPGGVRASQTDLMVLARNDMGTVAIGVEGKVEEEFGPTIGQKRAQASDGQTERLAFLHQQVGLDSPLPDMLRYQLLHRMASAVMFAEESHARAAVVLVHSFSAQGTWFEDFRAFAEAFGVNVAKEAVARVPRPTRVPVYLGWVSGDPRFTKVDIPAAAFPQV
jgi:hypothetical protein